MTDKPPKGRILLADDEPHIVKMTQLRLEHEGYAVETAGDGQAVVEAVQNRGPFDLILLDLRMPKMDGYAVCQRLKGDEDTAHIPIMLFSATTGYSARLADKCLELGAEDWIRKPFDSKDLLAKIDALLQKRRQP